MSFFLRLIWHWSDIAGYSFYTTTQRVWTLVSLPVSIILCACSRGSLGYVGWVLKPFLRILFGWQSGTSTENISEKGVREKLGSNIAVANCVVHTWAFSAGINSLLKNIIMAIETIDIMPEYNVTTITDDWCSHNKATKQHSTIQLVSFHCFNSNTIKMTTFWKRWYNSLTETYISGIHISFYRWLIMKEKDLFCACKSLQMQRTGN